MKINPSLIRHNGNALKSKMDWNEVIPYLHAEGVTVAGLICVSREFDAMRGGHNSFIQWINTEPPLQALLLDAIKSMVPTNKIITLA
jgi:hypothetical protein